MRFALVSGGRRDGLAVERRHGSEELRCDLLFAALCDPSYPSLPDARPRSERFRRGGRESKFLQSPPLTPRRR